MSFVQLPVPVHQAAIAGKVIDAETGRAVAGVTAAITAMPAAFQTWLAVRALSYGAAWAALPERPDRTRTAVDGCFRFADLPDGAYTVSFSLPGAPHRYGSAQHAFAVASDVDGWITLATAEIELPPTGFRGKVHGLVQGAPVALPLARARVDGTGEVGYGDEQGRFYLTGVELGARTVKIGAIGFLPATSPVQITEGVITDLGTFELDPATV